MANDWALILGASSGFGEATSLELARSGYNIFGVHLDLRATLPNAQRIQDEIRSLGREAVFFNVNAADADKRATVVEGITERVREDGDAFVRVLLHSLAFGTLLPFIAETRKDALSQKQMEMTLDVMPPRKPASNRTSASSRSSWRRLGSRPTRSVPASPTHQRSSASLKARACLLVRRRQTHRAGPPRLKTSRRPSLRSPTSVSTG
jgi:NAD(P)-dependent dehydrogenase (short-subunit alcohol dehydrogenase family)